MKPLSTICCQRNPDPERQLAAIDALIRSGADIHETDKNGVTPLHHAVRFRSPAAVEALLMQVAAVNQPCKRSGSTALHRAVTSAGAPGTAGKEAETLQIIALLMRYGADPTIKNRTGKAPADYLPQEEARRLFGTH